MAENRLGQYLLGVDQGREMAAGAMMRTEAALLSQMQMHQMRWDAYDFARSTAGMPVIGWMGERESGPCYTVTGGEGNNFIARYECEVTKECFELASLERPAVERGMRHYVERWRSAIRHLREAGMKDEELHIALAVIKPRLVSEAQHERSQEEGLREAEAKAKALLLMCLTPTQQAEFAEHHYFTIEVDHKVSGLPTGAFRIAKGSSFNVTHVESGETFCVVAQEKVPVYDQMLTQKLLLEQEPERFFKTANRSQGYGLRRQQLMSYQDLVRLYTEPEEPGVWARTLRALGLD